jgi:hypothetical protein
MQNDLRTFLNEATRHVLADACGAAGDENDLVLESHDEREVRGSFYGEHVRCLKP